MSTNQALSVTPAPQLGLLFDDAPAAAGRRPVLWPEGTWTDPAFTKAQFFDLIDSGREAVGKLAAPVRALFERGLAVVSEAEGKVFARKLKGEACRLWRTGLELSEAEADAFTAYCEEATRESPKEPGGVCFAQGYEFRFDERPDGDRVISMWAPGVGTVIVFDSPRETRAAGFRPYRAAELRPGFRALAPRHRAPESVWQGSYCADRIGAAHAGIASVPTFRHGGREFVNVGGSFGWQFAECTAWTVCPRDQWSEMTFSYQDLCRAWDEGSKERGDESGLIVRIRGQLCVLDSAALFFDDRPITVRSAEFSASSLSGADEGQPGANLDAEEWDDDAEAASERGEDCAVDDDGPGECFDSEGPDLLSELDGDAFHGA